MKNFFMAMVMACLMSMGVAYAADNIDVNTATSEQLQSVKGIGIKTAAAIVAYREAHGAFKSVNDLVLVKGIGKKKLAKIESHIEISDSKAAKK